MPRRLSRRCRSSGRSGDGMRQRLDRDIRKALPTSRRPAEVREAKVEPPTHRKRFGNLDAALLQLAADLIQTRHDLLPGDVKGLATRREEFVDGLLECQARLP